MAHDERAIIAPPDHKWARRSRVVSATDLRANTPANTRTAEEHAIHSPRSLHQALGATMRWHRYRAHWPTRRWLPDFSRPRRLAATLPARNLATRSQSNSMGRLFGPLRLTIGFQGTAPTIRGFRSRPVNTFSASAISRLARLAPRQ